MIVQIIGWFCLFCASLMEATLIHSSFDKYVDKDRQANGQRTVALFLIAAAICFK